MSATDKLRKASGSTRPVVTTLSLPKANGASTAELTSATGWNTATGIDVVIYRRQLNTTTGLYEKIDGTQTDWTAQLTGTTLSGMVLQAGTEPAAGYAADGNTVVLAGPTAQWGDDLIETLLTLFNQDQSLKSTPIRTALGISSNPSTDWSLLNAGVGPSSVTDNGNGSYDLVFAANDLTSVVSPGMRGRTTRTVAAPTQCTSLNGTTQYFSKSSPAGMTFTNNFVAGAWVKLSSYANSVIISRYNGTSGWDLEVLADGRVALNGFNAGAANVSQVYTYQSIPLNKWVHISAQLDMSAFTATTTTSYVMLNGVDVPVTVSRGGTNPTAIIQAGNLEIGSRNGGLLPLSGKIAQAFVSSAKITQANVRLIRNQGLTSALITSNSIVSAYSFDNSINDLNTTNANNLTANGSAVATNADSFAGQQASGLISSTLDYFIVQKATYSTNTTLTVQVPEGNTIPTSGGVTNVYFASVGKPYGMPVLKRKFAVQNIYRVQTSTAVGVSVVPLTGASIQAPVGEWGISLQGFIQATHAGTTYLGGIVGLSTATSSFTSDLEQTKATTPVINISSAEHDSNIHTEADYSVATVTPIYLVSSAGNASTTMFYGSSGTAPTTITLENAYV